MDSSETLYYHVFTDPVTTQRRHGKFLVNRRDVLANDSKGAKKIRKNPGLLSKALLQRIDNGLGSLDFYLQYASEPVVLEQEAYRALLATGNQ